MTRTRDDGKNKNITNQKTMNKIGFNVLAWSANMSDDLKPILDRLKKIGYDGAEFFVGSDDVPLTNESENIVRI
jgi:hypothetical protein